MGAELQQYNETRRSTVAYLEQEQTTSANSDWQEARLSHDQRLTCYGACYPFSPK